ARDPFRDRELLLWGPLLVRADPKKGTVPLRRGGQSPFSDRLLSPTRERGGSPTRRVSGRGAHFSRRKSAEIPCLNRLVKGMVSRSRIFPPTGERGTMMSDGATAYVAIRREDGSGDVCALMAGQRYTLGRATTNRIVLKDELCSREHAEIY